METKQELLTKMQELKACKDAIVWIKTLNTDLASEVWDRCQRGDWLLWLARELGADRKLLVSGACASARTSLPYIKDPQALEIATKALVIAEKWTKGEATEEEMKIAASAATDATDAAYAYAAATSASASASYASSASAYASASASVSAASAAAAASYAASAAHAAAYAAASDAAYAAYAAYDAAYAARTDSLANTAKIVKDIIKWEDLNF